MLALLQNKQLGTSKHAGAIALFDREYVKCGDLDSKFSKILHRAFELRQKGDYMEQSEIVQADIDEMLPAAEEFVAKAKNYLLGDNG